MRPELTAEQAESALAKLLALPIERIAVLGQRQRAWKIAIEFDFATVYDATYPALAGLRGCQFWTADLRLFSQVKGRLPFVERCG